MFQSLKNHNSDHEHYRLLVKKFRNCKDCYLSWVTFILRIEILGSRVSI